MKTDELNNNHILAEEGKVFRRISDGQLFGREIYLGYAYYIAGELLAEPLLELPEHYEEIDDPVEEETVLIDEDMPLEENMDESRLLEEKEEESETTEEPVRRRVTVADYHRLEKQVELLMQMIGGVE